MSDPLEIAIECAWRSLLGSRGRRTIYLTSKNHLVWGERVTYSTRLECCGVFTRAISLADFREAVFATHDQRTPK